MANLNLKFLRGLQESLPTAGTDGYFYLTTDTHRLYTSIDGKVVPVNEGVVTVANLDALASVTGANAGDFFYCTQENILCVYNGQTFVQINPDTGVTSVEVVGDGNAVTDASYDPATRKLTLTKSETFATKAYVGDIPDDEDGNPMATSVIAYINKKTDGIATSGNLEALGNRVTTAEGKITALEEASAKHVEKVEGKGLSTNDLTDELKGQYDAAYQHSLLDHAPANAQANIIESVKVNGTALEIKDKAVDIAIPTGALAGKDEVAKDDLAEALATEIDNKVAKEDGKSLVLDTEITKLAGVSEGANKVEKSDTNGNIKIDGTEVVVYTHPDKHAIDDVTGLQDALNGLQAKGDYAAEEHTHTKDEITDFAHTHVAADITDLDTTIKAYGYATKTELNGVDAKFADKADKSVVDAMYTNGQIDTAVQGAKDYAKGLVDAIPAQTDYSVTITENTDDNTVAKTYVFSQCGAEIGSIKLAKELVVTSGSVKEVETADAPYAGAKAGDKYIELVIANQDAPIYVPAKDLVDIYTAKDGATEVQVAISNTNEISATLVNGGITEEKLAEGVKTKLNKVYEEVGVAQGLVDGLANGQVKTNKEAIDAINNADTGILKQAKDYADGLADNYAATEHDHVAADITDFATEVAKVKVAEAVKADEATKAVQDGNGDVIADTYAKKATTLAGYGITDAYTKEETANQDAVVLAEAQKYTDGAKTTLEGTITSGDEATLESAKSYCDSLMEWGSF